MRMASEGNGPQRLYEILDEKEGEGVSYGRGCT